MSPVRVGDVLSSLLSAVPLDESFQSEPDGIGPCSCDSLGDLVVDVSEETIVNPSNELRHANSIAIRNAPWHTLTHSV